VTLLPNDQLRLEKSARRMLDKGDDIESVIEFLRNNGANQIDSIKILKELTGRDVKDCKALLHSSKTWEDRRELDRQLHDLAEAGIEDIADRKS